MKTFNDYLEGIASINNKSNDLSVVSKLNKVDAILYGITQDLEENLKKNPTNMKNKKLLEQINKIIATLPLKDYDH